MCYWRMQHRIFYYQCLIICISSYDIQLIIDIFGDRVANAGVTYGLLDSTSIENFMTTLTGLQEKWDSIEKGNGHAKGNQYSFYEWFLH